MQVDDPVVERNCACRQVQIPHTDEPVVKHCFPETGEHGPLCAIGRRADDTCGFCLPVLVFPGSKQNYE